MLLANAKFNHETDSFHESLGISNEIRTRCRERIFFTSLSNAFQREELFEDPDDAPRELHTVSGDMQRLLQSITDQLEYEYTLLIFSSYQRMAKESFAYYKHMRDSKVSKEDKLKSMIIELIEEMRSKHEKDENEEGEDSNEVPDAPIDKLNKQTLLKRISFVKKSHHNFDTYMNLLTRWANADQNDQTEKKPDIDDLLRNLFSKDEE